MCDPPSLWFCEGTRRNQGKSSFLPISSLAMSLESVGSYSILKKKESSCPSLLQLYVWIIRPVQVHRDVYDVCAMHFNSLMYSTIITFSEPNMCKFCFYNGSNIFLGFDYRA